MMSRPVHARLQVCTCSGFATMVNTQTHIHRYIRPVILLAQPDDLKSIRIFFSERSRQTGDFHVPCPETKKTEKKRNEKTQ